MFGRHLWIWRTPRPDRVRRHVSRRRGESAVVSPKLWKLAAIPIGLALAGVPAAAVHAWLGHYIEQEGVKDLDVAGQARHRADRNATRPGDRGARRSRGARRHAPAPAPIATRCTRCRSATSPVKEVSLVDHDGETVCTNLAMPFGAAAGHLAADRKPAQRNHHRGHPARRAEATTPCASARSIADGSWLAALVPVRSADPADIAERRSDRRECDARARPAAR